MSNVEKEYAWKVCVRCFTFNHAPYIEDALNGFCMQETDFPFICTIVDDASTDGEQEVIKKYLEEHFDLEDKSIVRNEETEDYTLTFARHKTNTNCYFAVLFLKYNHYSIKKDKMPYIAEWHENCKYIALCEGDDYWIDGKKLQKQAEFMEKHSGCSMVLSNGYGYKVQKKRIFKLNPIPVKSPMFLSPHDLLIEKGGLIPTASMFFKESVENTLPFWAQKLPAGDRPLRMWAVIHGDVYYDTNPMLIYRIGSIGSFNQRSQNYDYAQMICQKMCKFYDDFDTYTNGKLHDEIQYMIDREEYDFYSRVGDHHSKCKSAFYKRQPIHKRLLIKIISFIRIFSQRIKSFAK